MLTALKILHSGSSVSKPGSKYIPYFKASQAESLKLTASPQAYPNPKNRAASLLRHRHPICTYRRTSDMGQLTGSLTI